MILAFIAKLFVLFTLIFFVCPLVFVLLAMTLGRFFRLSIAPDSLVARLQQNFIKQKQK